MLCKRELKNHRSFMKKMRIIFVMAALIQSFSTEAVQISIVPTDPPFSGAHMIPGTDFFWEQTDTGYILYDRTGTSLPCGEVAGWKQGSCGLLPVASANDIIVMGVLSSAGDLVIPFGYDDIKVLNKHWAIGLKYDLYHDGELNEDCLSEIPNLKGKADFYYLEDAKAVLSGTLSADESMTYCAFGNYINIMDSSGTVVGYDNKFNSIEPAPGKLDDFPHVLLMHPLSADGHHLLKQDTGRIILCNASGENIIGDQYIIEAVPGDYLELKDIEGFYGIAGLDGKILVPVKYDSILPNDYAPAVMKGTGGIPGFAGYFTVESDGFYGFVFEGAETVRPVYDADTTICNGVTLFALSEEQERLMISADGFSASADKYSLVTGGYD